MHDLIPLGPALSDALTTAESDATMAYAGAEKAPATREAYASDWRDFAAWYASRAAAALPAHVGAYLTWLAGSAAANHPPSASGRPLSATGTRLPDTSRPRTRRG